MSDKPKVFPTAEQIAAANQTGAEIAQEQEQTITSGQVSYGEAAAAAEMARRTQEQLRLREEALINAERLKGEELTNQDIVGATLNPNVVVQPHVMKSPMENLKKEVSVDNSLAISELSQPQMNQPYDIIPLPSEGKLYRNKKGKVKVSFLTAADENILTSPNLLESGDFLEILLNRKVLEPELRYKDLLPGDRDAIMIWLRATGYGEMYPVTILDENNKPFDTEVDLTKLKVIKLTVEPDTEGLFSFTLPLSKSTVKFKLLTVGEIDELEKLAQFLKEENNLINTEATLLLEAQIVDVDGIREKTYISDFIENMRIMDSKKLKAYMADINCGIDMNIKFWTPGGESVTRFLPFTLKFFWPEFEL
jgi:hypothetical protein